MPDLQPVDSIITQLLNMASQLRQQQPLDAASVPLLESLGRVSASGLTSPVAVPPHANSAMDGIALRLHDLAGSDSHTLPLGLTCRAGQPRQTLPAGTAARIFTGASIPTGADTIVMQENCQFDTGQVRVMCAPVMGEHIRPQGQDIALGSTILQQGERITAAAVGVLASAGMDTIPVYRRLRVGVLCSGDELVMPGNSLQDGQIYNSNFYTIAAVLNGWGCEVINLGQVPDNLAQTVQTLSRLPPLDMLLTTGGVSVGDADFLRDAIQQSGELMSWKVAIKPGKPVAVGRIGQLPVIGLPGNPQSVWVTLLILIRPMLHRLQGRIGNADGSERQPMLRVRAGFTRARSQGRREYLRVRLVETDDGLSMQPYPNQSSGVLLSAQWAYGLALWEQGTVIAPDDLIPFLPFAQLLS